MYGAAYYVNDVPATSAEHRLLPACRVGMDAKTVRNVWLRLASARGKLALCTRPLLCSERRHGSAILKNCLGCADFDGAVRSPEAR